VVASMKILLTFMGFHDPFESLADFSEIGLRESSVRSVMSIEDAPRSIFQAPLGAACR
jgi:hypothetical protein